MSSTRRKAPRKAAAAYDQADFDTHCRVNPTLEIPGSKKGKGRKRTTAGKTLQQAMALGRAQVKWVLAHRSQIAAQRRTVVKSKLRSKPGSPPKRAKDAPVAAHSRGVLVAEGDSWFDYPFHDVLKELDDSYGWEIEQVAHAGDTVEGMAYGGGQLDEFVRAIERVVRRGQRPHAILLSGGGNDFAGEWFGMLLNHRNSPDSGLNPDVVSGVLEQRARTAYATILTRVTEACIQMLGAPVPILLHGYDYPVPDGRGVLGGWGPLPGPWLEPGFRKKGFRDLQERIGITHQLIDRFYAMLQSIVDDTKFGHAQIVNLRLSLSTQLTGDEYRKWWGNELHPTERGFAKVAGLFDSRL
jgi:lysophospholipase L1-like esterase